MVVKRFTLTLINIFFPPLTILLLCGPETDLIINCLLFLAAIIPSHVHAFYISCTYFNRKRKVRKGIYPGKRRWGIFSQRVQNGGASDREIRRLKKEMTGGKEVDIDYYDDESVDGRRRSRARTSGYGTVYGNQVQQVPSRSRTRNSGYSPNMQQARSRSRTRNSGYGAQDSLSRTSTRRSQGY